MTQAFRATPTPSPLWTPVKYQRVETQVRSRHPPASPWFYLINPLCSCKPCSWFFLVILPRADSSRHGLTHQGGPIIPQALSWYQGDQESPSPCLQDASVLARAARKESEINVNSLYRHKQRKATEKGQELPQEEVVILHPTKWAVQARGARVLRWRQPGVS